MKTAKKLKRNFKIWCETCNENLVNIRTDLKDVEKGLKITTTIGSCICGKPEEKDSYMI